jgi:hypothetical protein
MQFGYLEIKLIKSTRTKTQLKILKTCTLGKNGKIKKISILNLLMKKD